MRSCPTSRSPSKIAQPSLPAAAPSQFVEGRVEALAAPVDRVDRPDLIVSRGRGAETFAVMFGERFEPKAALPEWGIVKSCRALERQPKESPAGSKLVSRRPGRLWGQFSIARPARDQRADRGARALREFILGDPGLVIHLLGGLVGEGERAAALVRPIRP